jgi:hypothetical protein
MFPELAWKLPRIAIARFLASFVLYALWIGLTSWLVSMLKAFTHPSGSLWKRIALAPLTAASVAITYIVHAVGHALSYSVSHSMPAAAHWLNQLATREDAINNAEANFAEQTARSFERLVAHTIPAEIKTATKPIEAGIDALENDIPRLRARLEHFRVGIDRLIFDNVIPRVRANERAIAVTLPRAIAREGAQIKDLQRILFHPSDAWIKRIMKRGWVLVLAGVVVKFLVKKWPQLFCRNVTKVAKTVCGWPNLLADLLLGEAVAAFVITDMCDLVVAIEKVAEGFEPALRVMVTGGQDFLDHCGGDLPSAHDPAGYSGGWTPSAT